MKFQIILLTLCFLAYAASEGFECSNGVAYRQNDCNTCRCADKKLACTRMVCNTPESKKLSECTVGSTFTMNGKECHCVEEYGTICVQ